MTNPAAPRTMRTAVFPKPGGAIEIVERPVPAPAAGAVRVLAVSRRPPAGRVA